MKAKTFHPAQVAGKTILLRVDFNVPMQAGKIKDDFKIQGSVEFIKFLIEKKAKVILISHLGEPVIGRSVDRRKLSLKIIASHLSRLLGRRVFFWQEPVGSAKLSAAIKKLKVGQVAMLENIRFYKGEASNDVKFARDLAELADVYINNAFAVCHRTHASVSAIKKYLPSFAGPLLVEEVKNLQKVLKPVRPLVAVMGGAKIETKISLIRNLLKRSNAVLVGGALANNFLAARRLPIGRSLTTPVGISLAKKINKKKIILPVDLIVQTKDGCLSWRHPKEIKKGEKIVDIGPETMKLFGNYIKRAKTLIWNGPMGCYEESGSHYGTLFVARAVASRSSGKAFGLVGGGETVDALKMTKMTDDVDWISAGGGATLAYLGGVKLPGLRGIIK